ncbi:SH3 domain-containing protein 19 [Dunckerocampus dactyliophorus]|uniref:SH3 domain-containing protein 19 n=1 Tax=Dunckerocampus dactyliophorus TaxID=161453 RepID=UPI0024053632|nr:SH3 domain-containing protein 19 [Dunckerocampus dactyliophorus]
MAEARPEEEENMRRNTGEQVIRRQPNSTEGRPDRRKPENRLSQGPLWSLKAAIKKTTSRSTSFSETPRDRNRDGDRRGSRARRPDITILSAEPLPSTSWFPPPPPPAAQIWGPTIPPSVQPPPSYDEVIREKTQEQSIHTSSAITSHPAFRTIISTQTDAGSPPDVQESPVGHDKPLRPPLPSTVSQDGISSPLTPISEGCKSEQLPAFDAETPSAKPPLNEVEHPRPRPRSRLPVTPVSNEVKVQTLVKLREDGLATLAARASANVSKQDVIQGKYFQELLEAFSADDWGFPECPGDDSGLSQSEEDEEEKDMAALKARIQTFEQQQVGLDNEKVDGKKPEPRPRPRLQGQSAKMLPPTVAPKPKSLLKAPQVVDTLSTEGTPEELNPQPVPESVPPSPAPIPSPRLPPTQLTLSPSETHSTDKDPSRPPIPLRTVAPAHDKAGAGGNVTPARPPRPSMQVIRGAQTTNTLKLTGPTPEPTAVPSTALVHARSPPPALTKADSISQPPLPPRPSSVKSLPPRPPPMKSVPARPPPPASVSSVSQPPQAPSNQMQGQRVSKKGPPLPPRPNPGHPLFNSCMPATHSKDTDNKHESKVPHCQTGMSQKQEVLIILDDPPPAHCLMDLHVLPPVELSKPALESVKPSEWPTMQKHPEPPPISGPRCVALFDFKGIQDDELTFSQGDVISLLELIGTEWGRGQISGRVGLFPLSFTRVTEPILTEGSGKPPLAREGVIESPAAPQSSKETQVDEWVVALFDFPAQTAEDLSFHKGALIQVTQHVDLEWRRGRLDGREGLYPAAFTQACQAQPIPKQESAERGVAKALFAFTAKSGDELTVKAGDIITLVEPVDEQWIVGVVGSRRGLVPKNYICLL